MQKARAFFFVCAGIFLLALSYHPGARSATAQAGSTIVTGTWSDRGGGAFVVTTSGDCYFRRTWSEAPDSRLFGPLFSLGNFWSDGPTPLQQESWGSVKARYRGERQPATEGR